MTSALPLATVVIPTRDRRQSIATTLAALAVQSFPPGRFEVIVAANACTDDTVPFIRALEPPFTLRVLDLPRAGASEARNAGVEAARAPLLVFLDDDIEVAPEFVAAHLAAHGIDESFQPSRLPLRVAVGYLPADLQPEADFFAIALRGWWEAMFDRMREPEHRWGYADLLSGNFSLPREAFLRHGGFDTRYRCHEDYELGYRLIRAGAMFMFAEAAWGRHTDFTRLERACWRKREEGRADAQLAHQHPELRTALPIAHRTSVKQRIMRWLAFRTPRAGDALVALLGRLLGPLERVGARFSWLRVLYAIFGYWYERGLADALGTHAALRSLLSDAWDDPRLTDPGARLDVTDVEAAERLLDADRPAAVTLCIGDRRFGHLAYQPGTEPLAARHLRPALVRIWHRAYVEALIAEDRVPALAAGRPPTASSAGTSRTGSASLLSHSVAPPSSP